MMREYTAGRMLLRIVVLTISIICAIGVVGCPGKPSGQGGANQQVSTQGPEGVGGPEGQPSGVVPEGPIRIAFVPSVEAGSIELELQEFDTKLGRLLGHEVESRVVLSYTACIEQMGAGHFEAALLPTLAYVFAHDRYNARVVLKAVRNGSPTYRGEIITRVDSGINSLQDLKGRTFGFVDPSSASGCLYPKTLLITSGINPDTDLAEVTYIGSHPAVVEAVLQGRVDAGACFDDARTRLVETEPNIMQETKVVAYTPAIPSDTVTFREDCVGPFYNRLVQALVELSKEGKEGVLYRIYQIEGLVPAQDTDYDPIRQMIQTLDLDLASEIDKKG